MLTITAIDYDVHVLISICRVSFAQRILDHLLLLLRLVAATKSREFSINVLFLYLEGIDILIVDSPFVLGHELSKASLFLTFVHLILKATIVHLNLILEL